MTRRPAGSPEQMDLALRAATGGHSTRLPCVRYRMVPITHVRVVAEPVTRPRPAGLRSSAECFAMLRTVFDALHDDREHFIALYLDNAHRVLAFQDVTQGTLNLALVAPREVFRPAFLLPCAGVIVAHNHPSGDPAPSAEDVSLTRQLYGAGQAVGMPLLDHLIVGHGRYYSMADQRRLEAGS